VAVSINLTRVLSLPHIPRRAGQALILLATPVFAAIAMLTPGQPTWGVGVELIIIGAVIGPSLISTIGTPHQVGEQPLWSWLLIGVLPPVVLSLAMFLAGISFVADLPGLGGLYWIPLGTALAWVSGLFNAWVLLVEIMR
jgi:hypothetical protein